MLRPTHIAPTISACAYMCGHHDFNKMPLAPMECVVLLHNKPDIRKTWDDFAAEGYYIKISKEHYRCCKILLKNTKSIHIFDTLFFKQKYITMPEISKADAVVVPVTHLAKNLQGEIPANICETSTAQLIWLVNIFQQTATRATNPWTEQQSNTIPWSEDNQVWMQHHNT